MKTQTILILAGTAIGGYIFYTKFLSTPTPLLTANGATVAKPTGTSTGTTSFFSNLINGITGGGSGGGTGNILSSAGSAIGSLFGGSSTSTGGDTGLIDSNTTANQINAISGGYDPNTGTYSTLEGPQMPSDDGTSDVYTPSSGDQDMFDALGGNG